MLWFYLFIGAVFVATLHYLLRALSQKPVQYVKKLIFWAIIAGGLLTSLFLLRSGMTIGGILTGAFSFLYPLLHRFMQIRALWQLRQYASRKKQHPPGNASSMTPAQARKILGVHEHASQEDIQKAYKRLISKLHPDKDGSAYLAQIINEARDILIKNSL